MELITDLQKYSSRVPVDLSKLNDKDLMNEVDLQIKQFKTVK